MPRINRRHVLGLLGMASAAPLAALGSRPARAGQSITVLNWQGYGTDEKWAVAAFKQNTGIAVTHDYFSSEPEMITKLRTNPGAYDVVLCNSARVSQVQSDDLLSPIDLAKLPNAANLTPKLRDSPSLVLGGKTYGVAWVWGMTALAARTGRGALPDSWTALSDPANKGRVALDDDAIAMIGIGALLTGQDINAPKDFAAIKQALRAMKPGVKLLWSSEDQWNKAFAAREFDLAPYWSGGAVRSIRRYKLPLAYIVPKEGAIGWLDSLTVPASSTKKDAALAFINYMIDPHFYVEWVQKAGAPAAANASAMGMLPAGDLNRAIYKAEYLPHLQFEAPLSDDVRQQIGDLWEETKAYFMPREAARTDRVLPGWVATVALLLPTYAWLTLAVFLPLCAMLLFSVLSRAPFGHAHPVLTFANYLVFVRQPHLLGVAWTSLKIGFLTTALCAAIGLPAALALKHGASGRLRSVLFLLVILPFWTNGLVRIFSWTMVLRQGGLLDMALHAIAPSAPSIGILFSQPAIIVGLVHGYLPYMILTCFIALLAIDDSLIEAARSLGARAPVIFLRVILPLVLPGLVSGAILIFVPVIGSFMEPRILGGRVGVTMGTVIEDEFTANFNWPRGAALSFTMLAVVLAIFATFSGVLRRAARRADASA